MSKWGIEEPETLSVIQRVGFYGNVLNIAAGDGRFNNKLLEMANKVLAIDIEDKELKILEDNCPNKFKSKLQTKKVDITEVFPFGDDKFDGIFCTGTLHLFKKETIIKILKEIKRVLKPKGKIILDFATDIKRLDSAGKFVVFENEGSYTAQEAILLFQQELGDFSIEIEIFNFSEENLDEEAGYESIEGKFLVISGSKK
ncbi:MAG: class I SAM-dependent methyltransferase [Bacilli bacterium]|nr:class I SAM-dependent methyltransferase [Bacilli bacterium]